MRILNKENIGSAVIIAAAVTLTCMSPDIASKALVLSMFGFSLIVWNAWRIFDHRPHCLNCRYLVERDGGRAECAARGNARIWGAKQGRCPLHKRGKKHRTCLGCKHFTEIPTGDICAAKGQEAFGLDWACEKFNSK